MSSKQPHIVPPAQSTIKCAGCDSEFDINWFCKNCAASLCDICKTRHETDRFLRNHNIVPRTGSVIRTYDSSKVNAQCPEHPDREISVFCNDCGDPCCITCIAKKHRRHDVIAIEMKYMECEDKLNELVMDIKKNKIVELQSNIEQLKEKLTSSEMQLGDMKEKVNKLKQELSFLDPVDRSCDKFIIQLEQRQTKQKTVISEMIENFEKLVNENEHFMSLCADKVRKGGLGLIAFCNLPVPSNTRCVPDISHVSPEVVHEENLFFTIMNSVGKIRWEDTDVGASSCVRSTKSQEVMVEQSSVARRDNAFDMTMACTSEDHSKSTIVFKLMPDENHVNTFNTEITGGSVVPAGKCTAWVSSGGSDALYMYDENGREVKSFIVTKGSGIWDIAVKRSGDIIACNKDKKVRLLTTNGDVYTLFDTTPFSPKGVCLTKRGRIVVCMGGQGNKNHVAMYSSDGKRKVRDIAIKASNQKHLLNNHYRVAMNGDDISVLNWGSNVVTVSHNGEVRWVYDGSQSKLKRLDAQGMCVDKFCNLLISDYDNHCVHYVDGEGVLMRILLTRDQHGIEFPWGIGVDDVTGNVWVGTFEKGIMIAKYLE